jgi:hypothetical protein
MQRKLEENNDTICRLHAARNIKSIYTYTKICKDKFIFANNQHNKTYRNKELKYIVLGKVKDIIGATELTAYLVRVNMKKQ